MKTEVKDFGQTLEECYETQKLCSMLLWNLGRCGLFEMFTIREKDFYNGNDLDDLADLMKIATNKMRDLIEAYEASAQKIEMLPPPPIQDLQDFLDSI